MKVGLLYDLRNAKRWFVPFPQFYAQTLEHMQAMDELGFASLNMTEHHFDEDGYCPTTTIWNAAMAVKTKRAMLGQSLLLMPYVHPVRLAEDYATIDILSNGRAWVQVGAAYRPMEFEGFGIDDKHRFSRTVEGLDIMRRCFTEEEFSYEGRHFQLKNVRMTPKPVQKPHPPLFLNAARPGSQAMERTVEMGFHGIHASPITPPEPGSWDAWYARWEETIRRHGKTPADFQTSTIVPLFVTDDPERAWRNHREGLLHQYNSYRDHAGPSGLGTRPMLKTPEDLSHWQQYFQTPGDAVKYLHQHYGKHPPTHLLLWGTRPGMTYAESTGYHRLFMDKVMPRLQDMR